MIGTTRPGRQPGQSYTYYVCPHRPGNPRDAAAHPGHVRAVLKDQTITAAIATFDDSAPAPIAPEIAIKSRQGPVPGPSSAKVTTPVIVRRGRPRSWLSARLPLG